MTHYTCSYTIDGEHFTFHCQADDIAHAIEQLMDAEPFATNVTIYQG